MKDNEQAIKAFLALTRKHYETHSRSMPWRIPEADGHFDPYKIMVSEIMLQQTQYSRVIPKYRAFLETFPTLTALTKAKLADVLTIWNGLGYNRRAKYLWQAVQILVDDFNGEVPTSAKQLQSLPGIGRNTAGAILVYAFNRPALFIETNIRTVYIHHFFKTRQQISDREILAYLSASLDYLQTHSTVSYREFYWALMDYGAHLKQTTPGVNHLSKHYVKQSVFEGSRRQVRGQVIDQLRCRPQNLENLKQMIADHRLEAVLHDLKTENMIKQSRHLYYL